MSSGTVCMGDRAAAGRGVGVPALPRLTRTPAFLYSGARRVGGDVRDDDGKSGRHRCRPVASRVPRLGSTPARDDRRVPLLAALGRSASRSSWPGRSSRRRCSRSPRSTSPGRRASSASTTTSTPSPPTIGSSSSLQLTFVYAIVSVPLALFGSLLLAVLLNQRLRGTSLYRTFFFLPSLTPAVAVAILWTWLLQPDVGLFNYLLSLVGIQGPKWLGSTEWAMPSLIVDRALDRHRRQPDDDLPGRPPGRAAGAVRRGRHRRRGRAGSGSATSPCR